MSETDNQDDYTQRRIRWRIRQLLEGGADANARTDGGGTPLHCAAQEGQTRMVELLLDWGADINARDDLIGKTPLDLAVWNARTETVDVLCSWGAEGCEDEELAATPFQHEATGGHTRSMTGAQKREGGLGLPEDD